MLHNPYSAHYFPIRNPNLPYNGDIPNGLVPGKQVYIEGAIHHHADHFTVDFVTSHGIAFHFNTRFSEGAVVRNHSHHGSWGSEERQGPFPFSQGQRFELIFSVEHDRFRVAVNGVHAFDFPHRVPYQEISRINVHGDADLHQIVFSGDSGPRSNEAHPGLAPFSLPLHNVQPGKLIHILGNVLPHTGRFNINLQNGPGDAQNIALHFSVRFNDPYTQTVVVRTNRQNGAWNGGAEERSGGFPFALGTPFELLILLEHHEWKVAVNGHHFASFAHRHSFHEVNYLAVDGDVHINSVREY